MVNIIKGGLTITRTPVNIPSVFAKTSPLIEMVQEFSKTNHVQYTPKVLMEVIGTLSDKEKLECIAVSRNTILYITEPTEKMERLHGMKWKI